MTMTIKDLKEFLRNLPDDMEVHCIQDEVFRNGDRAPNYFPITDIHNCFTIEEGSLYIGDVEV